MSDQTEHTADGFKMTELGPLPEGWGVTKLGDAADIVMGQSPPSSTYNTEGAGLPFFQGKADFGDVHPVTRKWCSAPAKIADKDDVLLSIRAPIGDVNIATERSCIGRGLASIRANQNSDGEYLFHRLCFSRPLLESRGTGTTFKEINKSAVTSFVLPLPPLREQKAIARVLSIIEQAIEAQDKVIAASRELKKSLMRHLFTYGPVAVAEAEKVTLKETEIGPMPEHWEIRMISEVCEVKGSTVSLPQLIEKDTRDANHCMVHGIKVADMNLPGNERQFANANIRARLPESLAKRLSVPPDSIVFPKRGAAIATNKKRLTTTWTALDPNLIAVSPLGEVDCHYVFYWFLTIDIAEFQSPGPTPQLNKKDIAPVLMPIPPQREQQEVALILSSVDNKIEAETMRKASLQTLSKTMLHHLMTGRLRVKDMEGIKA